MSGLHNTRAYWSGVLAMTLCVFVLIASEFMPVSLLTPIAGDLHITEGLAGQGDRAFWRAGGIDQPDDFPSYRVAGP